jgi:hypothetical protein
LDKEHGEDDEKYYTVKREDGKEMKFAPNELSLMKEENELEEGTKMQVAQGRTRNVGTYGRAKGSEYGGTDWDKEETRRETKPAKRKYGARQNYVRSVKESFTDLLETYNEGGIKSLLQTMSSKIEEEVDNETFTAELEDQKASMKGKKKQPAVAKASVQAVKVEEEVEIEEGMQQTLRKYVPGYAKKQIDQKMDDGKFGKTDADKDANFYRYKKVQDKLKKEEVEQIDEDTMTHITLGKKVKNSEGGHSQDVHHKGKKIGSIESYKHRGEMRHGAFHDASGESTVGSRSPEGAISDLRFHHAQHLKSMREEAELHEESTYKLGRASAETKDFPIKHKGEHVGTLQFHTSAGKLHHRVSSVIGVSHEKFLNHPDKDNMVNAHVQKHESEARQHFAKKLKEDVEYDIEDFTLEEAKVDQGLSGKQKVAARAKRGTNEPGFNVGNTTGGQWRGKTEPSPYKDSNVAKSGPRKGMVTKSAIQKTKDDIKSRLNKEDVEQFDERELTSTESEKKEKYVKGMKKNLSSFKDSYGKRGKEVLYATATKMAKED